ncbi:hypothetical protein BLA29_014635 [Euroglyphus maynei]|uniref:Uncharacterized protein n=1 Tax=Euroglyphus maynei TaxID=6958 RepID=A0A1Y3B7Q3_EURMA|nr:hypothetical protein BLA29_014635 [Euroglyphus maynei]
MAHNNSIHLDDSDTSTNDSQTTTSCRHINCNNGYSNNNRKIQKNLPIVTLDVHKGETIRLQVKVMVPIDDHPNV